MYEQHNQQYNQKYVFTVSSEVCMNSTIHSLINNLISSMFKQYNTIVPSAADSTVFLVQLIVQSVTCVNNAISSMYYNIITPIRYYIIIRGKYYQKKHFNELTL